MEPMLESTTKWHKRPSGILALIFGGAFGIGLLFFLGVTLYYYIQIKQGNFEQLDDLVSSNQFTAADLSDDIQKTVDENITTFIRPHNPSIGSADAPVTILMFIDFECPFCQQSYPVTKEIFEKYAPAVRVVFKHYPLVAIHQEARIAANASMCADEQNKFWEFYDATFQGRGVTRTALDQYARDIGLNMIQFEQCMNTLPYDDQITQDARDGLTLGAVGTPTYFVNQRKVQGVIDTATWNQIILDALQ